MFTYFNIFEYYNIFNFTEFIHRSTDIEAVYLKIWNISVSFEVFSWRFGRFNFVDWSLNIQYIIITKRKMTTLSHKKPRRKNIQHSDPGKILDLVMSLTDDKCSEIQMKINTYVRNCNFQRSSQQYNIFWCLSHSYISTYSKNILQQPAVYLFS